MKKKKPEPVRSLVPMQVRVSPRFTAWLKEERKRRGLVTYARRYGLKAILGIAEEDDDGNAASQPSNRPAQAPQQRPATPQGTQGSVPPASVPSPAPPASQSKGEKPGLECPSCHEMAVIRGKKEYGGGWVCWKGKDGCGVKYTDSVWAMVSVPGPSSLDPLPKPARHEAPADVQDLTDESELPF